jgi:hypothetical protein
MFIAFIFPGSSQGLSIGEKRGLAAVEGGVDPLISDLQLKYMCNLRMPLFSMSVKYC